LINNKMQNNYFKPYRQLIIGPPSVFVKYCIVVVVFLVSSCLKKNNGPDINYQTFSVDENSAAGTSVGQVLAHDENGQGLSFSILDGNTGNAFVISEKEGILTVQSEDAIDYETNPMFTLLVEVRDSKNVIATSKIIIKVIDKNPPTNGLILYLPFDGNTNDLSGNNNHGIDYTSHKYTEGKRSRALDFNGTSDYIRLMYSINSRYGLSISFWVKTRGVNGAENNGAIVSKYSMSTSSRCFMIWSFGSYETRNDNRLSAAFYKYGTSAGIHDLVKSYMDTDELTVFGNPALWSIVSPKRLTTETWTHCVINVTSTSIEAWINGVLCVSKLREYSTYFDDYTEPVLIGNNYAIGEGSNNHFNGILDELRIYNRGLTVDEIRTIFKEY
jgi:hypothetical protein